MLSRVAASLYWMGRYVERAEFTARLIEATVRLDALSSRPAGEAAWISALAVIEAEAAFSATGEKLTPRNVARFLSLSPVNPGSVMSCLDKARGNAKAVRTALSRDAWATINRAWLLFYGRASPGDTQATLALMEQAQDETRGFEGALGRMLRNPATWFIRLGATIERADNTARLIDVKYHILLPEGERVGGAVDRDQWTTILQTLAAVNAYRWLYRDGLEARSVAELLVLRRELPRSLAACAEEVVLHLNALGKQTGFQGEADRMARLRHARLGETRIDDVTKGGLHEYVEAFIEENATIDQAISKQFKFL
ncbi:MAG: alpha-E domain-containing protein [Sphingomonadales bacterium]